MIEIDGSQGEGGGQVLRTSLTLSILTRQPIHIYNLRAGRKKPGLQAQHLQAVQAAVKISSAVVSGAALNSRELFFQPGEVTPGQYHFEIGTAGSTSLVLQTIYLPLSLAGGKSSLTITGGTHVPHSPCYHYLEEQWLPSVHRIGMQIDLNMAQAGFYPRGGGEINARIRPVAALCPLEALERGALLRVRGLAAVANLDPDIARRMKHQALRQLEPAHRDTKITTAELPSPGKGAFLTLRAEFKTGQAMVCALGAPGKRAERVADEAVEELLAFLNSDGAVDPYLADQLLLPLAFAGGTSRFRTSLVTRHLITNAGILKLFMPVKFDIDGMEGQAGTVTIQS